MYRIVKKEKWHDIVYSMWVEAPFAAQSAQPGQFIILIINKKGERIPLTIADYDREKGLIHIVFQIVGKTTMQFSRMKEGDDLYSFVGPLGKPTEIENYGTVVTVGGGTGIACVHPITRALKEAGNKTIAIIGAKSKELIIMEDEMRKASTELLITTDDGSYVRKGFVTEVLKEVLDKDKSVKKVWAIGPAVMMKFACVTTKPYDVETIVSLNAVMVDGTGMCGSCRATIGGETKFVCVDGPEFDGQLVDWDGFLSRLTKYNKSEKLALESYKETIKEGKSNG
ncbi:MAG: sulfide/dihydroorotate dehydrogenase-like FAD/NAD-binding protein [Campylobacterota bacterium]|nr:sulfide/dihydroorotate dehydrogenase-like FAD/NAD-binding protein [Campylobacterota bacterium]